MFLLCLSLLPEVFSFLKFVNGSGNIIKRSKFRKFQKFKYKYKQNWTIDEIIGFLYSTSFASRRLFGDKINEFEKELRKKLFELNPDGKFTETVICEAYLAWK